MMLLPLFALSYLLLGAQPAFSREIRKDILPLLTSPKVLQANNMTFPSNEAREVVRNEIKANITALLQEILMPVPPQDTPCGPGWTLAALLNMSDPSQQCPDPWTENVPGYPSISKRLCYRSESSVGSCDSVVYDTSGVGYDQVCGRIIGYQYANPHGFYPYHTFQYSIDTYYVDGMSVTHGELPRKHIWTFAAGFSERDGVGSCPCGSLTIVANIPPYVGNNYFCETAAVSTVRFGMVFQMIPSGMGRGVVQDVTVSAP